MVGLLAGLFGIGVGTINTPWLLWNAPLPLAIATASLLGIISAIAGTLTHIGSDLIHWQALLTIISGKLISAPFGARLTHRLPIHKLKKWFSLLIAALGMVMISQSTSL
jgi:hypothetical protein